MLLQFCRQQQSWVKLSMVSDARWQEWLTCVLLFWILLWLYRVFCCIEITNQSKIGSINVSNYILPKMCWGRILYCAIFFSLIFFNPDQDLDLEFINTYHISLCNWHLKFKLHFWKETFNLLKGFLDLCVIMFFLNSWRKQAL